MPEVLAGPTIGEAVEGATGLLAEAGCDSPRLDAEMLLADALRVNRARVVLDAALVLDRVSAEAFAARVARRANREPVAYIIGRKGFRRITLAVDRRVLIPRPETELLVEVGLSLKPGARVLDVGTGSGAIALALKDERPDLAVTGTDVSRDALAVARANGERLGLEVQWRESDLVTGVRGDFDAILSNLPYVAAGAALEPEIEAHEPAAALFAGADGLDLIRRLVMQAAGAPLLALEVGFDQARSVAGLVRISGFTSVEVLRDLAGHERVVVGRR